MENITQTVSFPAKELFPKSFEENGEGKEDLEELGITSPTDLVKVSIDLRSFIYELFIFSSPRYEAPLKIAQQQRQLTSLAAILDNDVFELPGYVHPVIEKTLSDDAIWTKFSVLGYIGEPGPEKDKKCLRLSARGLRPYQEIINATISIFTIPEG